MEEQSQQQEKKKDDGTGSVLGEIMKDSFKTIIKPKFNEIVNNFITDGIYMLADYASNVAGRKIFGPDSTFANRRNGQSKGTDYNAQYRNRQNNQTPAQQQQNIGMRSSADLQYVIAPNEETARAWKNSMIESIRRYGRVCVSEIYEKAGIKTIFSDFEYGWTKEEDIEFRRNRDGWQFVAPRPTKVK